jgi:hypothetical protein
MKTFCRTITGVFLIVMASTGVLWGDYDPVLDPYDPDEGVDARVSSVVQLTTEHSVEELDVYANTNGYYNDISDFDSDGVGFEGLKQWYDDDGDNSKNDWASCWGDNPWSSDGQWIIYTSNIPFITQYPDQYDSCYIPDPFGLRETYHHAICRIRPDGSGFQQMTNNQKGESHGSFLGPVENNMIVFQRGSDLWLKDMNSWEEPAFVVSGCQGDHYRAPAGEKNLTAAHENEPGIKVLSADEGDVVEFLVKHEEESEAAGEQKPVPSPDGSSIAFHRKGQIWTMTGLVDDLENPAKDAGKKAVNISGKRVDIPENGANIVFEPNGGGGFAAYMKTDGFEWESAFGAPLDICCGEYDPELPGELTAIPFNTFVFPFSDKVYGESAPLAKFTEFEGDGNLYISSNGFVSLGGSNYNIDAGCNNGGPDKLLNGNYARIAAFWTHLSRQLHVETDFGDEYYKLEEGCPDYGVYINAFDEFGNPVPVVTEKQYEGRSDTTQCCYDYFYAFDNPQRDAACVAACEDGVMTDVDQCCENQCRFDCADAAGCDTSCDYYIDTCIGNNTNGAGDCADACKTENCMIPDLEGVDLCTGDCAVANEVAITRMVITWYRMKLIDNDKRVNIQLQLNSDGRIVMGYDFGGDPDYEINSSKKVTIGVAPGNPDFERPEWDYGEDDYNYDWQAAVYPNPYNNRAGLNLSDYTEAAPYDSADEPVIYEFFYKLHGCTKQSWSPDGEWALFNGNPGCALYPNLFEGLGLHRRCNGGKQRIFKARPDGSDLVMLSELGEAGDYCDNWATWSPDGNTIAFHRSEDRMRQSIRLIDTDGVLIKELLVHDSVMEETDNEYIHAPTSWSPDSKWLAVRKDIEDGISLFAVNVENESELMLTKGYDDRRSWWGPDTDNCKILFMEKYGDSRDEVDDDDPFDDDLMVVNFIMECTPGDADGDGDSDIADINFLLSYLNQEAPVDCMCGDQDGDGMITVLDIRQLISENPILARDRRLRRLFR